MKKIAFFTFLAFVGCKSNSTTTQENQNDEMSFESEYISGPKTLVYKTKNDYNKLVPVLLSDDKTKIISYPHPSDLKIENKLALPTILEKGYLLDNRGIGSNVAFLKFTYKEYSKLEELPPLQELFKQIIDKDPLQELCECDNETAFKDIEERLNALIRKNELRTTCKIIK